MQRRNTNIVLFLLFTLQGKLEARRIQNQIECFEAVAKTPYAASKDKSTLS